MVSTGSNTVPILDLKSIVKSFPGTLAVDHVDFSCYGGEVHALVGENGAGKSTLMKVLAGLYAPDSGQVLIEGREMKFRNYSQARKAGVGVVYQELSLLPELSVAENIFMGTWPRNAVGLIDWPRIRRETRRILDEIGVDIHPDELIESLPMALRQMVEIAKVLNQKPKILVFDEPTAALSKDEVAVLFGILENLKDDGKGIIFISHRLDEVLHISDRITVMRDGQKVLTEDTAQFDEDRLILSMVGRELSEIFPAKAPEKVGQADVFNFDGILKMSGKRTAFTVKDGEVLGVGGLQGQGQLEMLESIFGLGHCRDMKVMVRGKSVPVNHPLQAIKSNIALIPENRNEEGVFLILGIQENLAAATLDRRSSLGVIKKGEETAVASNMVERLSIKIASMDQAVESLSGGNLQKVVLGKWLISDPKVIVMLEPTKGVDVGTKQQIYNLIRNLADNHVAVIVYTSDMLELIGLCDRVLVMNQGMLTASLEGGAITEENLMKGSVSNIDLLEAGGAI